MHPLVALAKEAIETYINDGVVLWPPDKLAPEMKKKAGVFVSLHKFGQLRGCIGTFGPAQENVAREVIINAISAAMRDPRFAPVSAAELKDLEINVDVLTKPRPIKNPEHLDPKRYGLIVQSVKHPWKRGLLLPDLHGIDTVEKQLHWTRYHKAGITDPNEPIEMFRFEVQRHT